MEAAAAEIEMKVPSTEQQIFWCLVPPMDGVHVLIDVNDPQIPCGHERDVGQDRKGAGDRSSGTTTDGPHVLTDGWIK